MVNKRQEKLIRKICEDNRLRPFAAGLKNSNHIDFIKLKYTKSEQFIVAENISEIAEKFCKCWADLKRNGKKEDMDGVVLSFIQLSTFNKREFQRIFSQLRKDKTMEAISLVNKTAKTDKESAMAIAEDLELDFDLILYGKNFRDESEEIEKALKEIKDKESECVPKHDCVRFFYSLDKKKNIRKIMLKSKIEYGNMIIQKLWGTPTDLPVTLKVTQYKKGNVIEHPVTKVHYKIEHCSIY